MDSTISTLNKSCRFIYWIYIYSYKEVVNPSEDMIQLFMLSNYTPFKNRALPSMILEKSLDLSTDEDLDIVLNHFKLKFVKSVSEMAVSKNTNLIAIEIDHNKPLKGFLKNTTHYFFSAHYPPHYYTERKPLDNNPSIFVPANPRLFIKLKVNIGRFLVTTNVIAKKVFEFLFNDYFDTVLLKKIPEKTMQRIVNKDYLSDSESEEVDLSKINDDELSYDSYCKKHHIKTID